MRVSTALLHRFGVEQMQRQQQALLRTQTQLTTQQRLLSAADGPADWAAGMGVEQLLAETSRYQANAKTAQHRLGLEENALAEGIDVLARVRELAIQANSGTQTDQTRAVIAQELVDLRDQLLAIGNRDDGQGRYLFAGSRDGIAPFSWNGSSAAYNGDQQVRTLQIGNNRSVAEGDAGSDVFQRLRTGDGSFEVRAAAANTGAISVQRSALYDESLWDGGSYTVRFSGGNYEVLDASNTVVDSGPYTTGSALRVRGVELTLSGAPADGDSFALGPAQQQDMFALIDKIADLVSAPQATPGARAGFQTGLQQALSELDTAESHLSAARTGAGLRLGRVEDAVSTLEAYRVEAQAALSDLRDVDIAEAASRLQQQLLAVEAAQASYARVQGLSLFDYLR